MSVLNYKQQLGRLISQNRTEKGMTQSELAKELGTSHLLKN